MTEKPKTEINEFILNAALKKDVFLPVFDSFRKLCKLQNDPNIDYVDFEWKYYQYFHGNRDLAIERSSENSSPMTFSDLPIDVLEKVVGKLDLVNCLRLRKVSRDLRNLVDSTEIHCEKVKFDFPWEIVVGSSRINYLKSDVDGCTVIVSSWLSRGYSVNQNVRTAMLADASAILQNPKLNIGHLEIGVSNEKEFPEFLKFLKSLSFQLNARSFHFASREHSVLPILELLKPKALEEIKLQLCNYNFELVPNQFRGIEETMQWKMAKKLYMNQSPDGVSIDKMLHFKKIQIDYFEFSNKNLIMIRDILLASSHLEPCSLEAMDFSCEDDEWYVPHEKEVDDEDINRIMSELPAFDPETRRIPIPNSQEHFQLKYRAYRSTRKLFIRRTTDKRRIEEFIRDAARRDKENIRGCIMFRHPVYLDDCSVFQSYKKLCEQEGNLLMDYVNFEWKYYQYYHGNRDITIEKSPENSSRVTFSDLPKNVLEEVVGNLNLAERLTLRNVSHDLRDLLDSTEVYCERMRLIFRDDRPEIWLPDDVSHFHQVTIAVALSLLKNPSLKIGHVDFVVLRRSNISEFLSLFDFQLYARSVVIFVEEADCIPRILQFLKPKILEEISFTNSLYLTVDQFNEIAKTEQWKEAKKLKCSYFSNGFQMEQMLHFNEIQITKMTFDNANLVKVRDILLKSTHLERCYLSRHSNDYYGDEHGMIDRIMSEEPAFDSENRRISIPNSRDYFQLEYSQNSHICSSIRITKISED